MTPFTIHSDSRGSLRWGNSSKIRQISIWMNIIMNFGDGKSPQMLTLLRDFSRKEQIFQVSDISSEYQSDDSLEKNPKNLT